DGPLDRLEITERHDVEAGRRLAEALEILLVAGGGDGGERAAVEGALEGDDAPALRVAVGEMVTPRQLDGALAGLGARVAEEYLVGERRLAQPFRQPLLAGDAVEVGAVPQLLGLADEGGDQLGMGMAQRVDGDAAGEIEVALARGGDEPRPLAALEHDVLARIGGHDGRRGAGRRLGRLGLGTLGGLRGGAGHSKTYLARAVENKKPRFVRGA